MITKSVLSILLLLLVGIAACSTSKANPAPAVPVAGAAAPEAPLADFAVPGRLLAVKDGGIFQWANGAFRPVAGGLRYQSPAFSADGTRIAAAIVGENHSDLVVLDTAGKRIAQLTDHWSKVRVQDSAWATHPAWSPDGRRIAYVTDAFGARISDSLGPPMSIAAVDAAGGNRHQIVPPLSLGGLDWPSWSPSGKDLAVVVFEETASQVARFNLASGAWKVLTRQPGGAYDPAWSPDGAYIAYVARTDGRSDIWLMGSDGSDPVRLTELGTARAPAWSPAGDLIAFVAEQGRSFDLFALKPGFPKPSLVPAASLKRLTDGQHVEAPSGLAWSR